MIEVSSLSTYPSSESNKNIIIISSLSSLSSIIIFHFHAIICSTHHDQATHSTNSNTDKHWHHARLSYQQWPLWWSGNLLYWHEQVATDLGNEYRPTSSNTFPGDKYEDCNDDYDCNDSDFHDDNDVSDDNDDDSCGKQHNYLHQQRIWIEASKNVYYYLKHWDICRLQVLILKWLLITSWGRLPGHMHK